VSRGFGIIFGGLDGYRKGGRPKKGKPTHNCEVSLPQLQQAFHVGQTYIRQALPCQVGQESPGEEFSGSTTRL
jgi:hypothetical protein